MFRIGILGSENSHAMAFARIFNKTHTAQYPDIRVTAIGGNYPEESRKIFEECGLELLAEKPEDMLGKVDAVMVTARDGAAHAAFARPFLEVGIPAFIDKPITRDPGEALALVKLAKEKGVPLVGGSSVKYAYDVRLMKAAAERALAAGESLSGDVTAPVSMTNDYGGFFFYASHLAEMSMTVFGYDPQSVTAFRSGDNVTAVVHYDRCDIVNRFLEGNYNYTITLNQKARPLFREVDISMIYQHECENFARMLRTGEMDQSYEDLILPVYYLRAVEESFTSGQTVQMEKPVL